MTDQAFESAQEAAELIFRLNVRVALLHERCSCDMHEGVMNHSESCAEVLTVLRAYGEWSYGAWKMLPDDD
ncbi:MAG: hypothetical protein IID41_06845 [Planctomycetes bacterium]|nr:hypothetical protein [Planctomycetota bacterium]